MTCLIVPHGDDLLTTAIMKQNSQIYTTSQLLGYTNERVQATTDHAVFLQNHTILFKQFIYFYIIFFFHNFHILSIFTAIETSLFVFTIYSFSKIVVAIKI